MNAKESLAFRFSPPFFNPPEPCSPQPTTSPSSVMSVGRQEEEEGVKKTNSESRIGGGKGVERLWKGVLDKPKPVHTNNILFTIQQNHYARKNNLLSPRGGRQRQTVVTRPSLNQLPTDTPPERKVAFTEQLISDERSNCSHESGRPIIRNAFSPQNFDTLSNSSRSVSVQNSLSSQFRSPLKNQLLTRTDSNAKKYTQMLSRLQSRGSSKNKHKAKQKEDKYTDNLFPPLYSSLFIVTGQMKAAKVGVQLQWRRLGDLYTGVPTTLIGRYGTSQARIVLPANSYATDMMAVVLNAVSHCSCILERMFETSTPNKHELYLLRIFQQNHWKSIILDEYIPVRVNTEGDSLFTPGFIDVKKNPNQEIELWPFLLEKAYAHYYSAYQFTRQGNVWDFAAEVMGVAGETVSLRRKPNKDMELLVAKLAYVDSVAIAQVAEDKFMVVWLSEGRGQEEEKLMCAMGPDYLPTPFTSLHIAIITKVKIYSPKKYASLSVATIGRYATSSQRVHRSQYSLRRVVVRQATDAIISVQQKDARFFSKASIRYEYMWMRVLLVQREFGGYRWIDGCYSGGKSVVLSASLTAGEYYLLLMPEWKKAQNFELSLMAWSSAGSEVAIQRVAQVGSVEEMVEQACMDLAQRKGKINQLTPALCAYNYICPQTGLIIENINNEQLKNDATVQRNVSGIPSAVELQPVNPEFYKEGKIVPEIEITIPKLSSFTVVLKMKGGVDRKLIRLFSKEDLKAD